MSAETVNHLTEDYYLDNFLYLLNFVASHYEHLLSANEQHFNERLRRLPDDGIRLYVRLTNRIGPYFRCDKINYQEIKDLSAAIEHLKSDQLLEVVEPPVEEAIELCSRRELLTLLGYEKVPSGLKKSELKVRINERAINPLTELGVTVVQLLGLKELRIFRLLFFGNFHQDMTEFVMHELVAPFESYEISRQSITFTTRENLELVLRLRDLAERAEEVLALDNNGDSIMALVKELPCRPQDSGAARRFDRLVNRLARQLERLKCDESALQLYTKTLTPPSRERQIRLLDKLGEHRLALNLCEAVELEPLNQEEQEFARYFATRLSQKSGMSHALPIISKKNIPCDTIKVRASKGRVEKAAADYYEGLSGRCFYVENALFKSLFGLSFWDIIFASVPGAFCHPFQRGPSDLYTGDFFINRREMIEDRLTILDKPGELKNRVLNVLDQKAGVANDFVYWGLLSDELLKLVLDLIPPKHLQIIFRRMLVDLKNNTSGFPDLICFDHEGYRLIEVKGPGDKLQKNQRRWFQYFLANGLPVSVVNVEWERA